MLSSICHGEKCVWRGGVTEGTTRYPESVRAEFCAPAPLLLGSPGRGVADLISKPPTASSLPPQPLHAISCQDLSTHVGLEGSGDIPCLLPAVSFQVSNKQPTLCFG